MGLLDQVQWSILKEKQTWQAFAIAIVLFSTISFGKIFKWHHDLLNTERDALHPNCADTVDYLARLLDTSN